jgi:hypothetical protein
MAKQTIEGIARALALTAVALTSCVPAAGSQTTIGVAQGTHTSRLQSINENLYPDTVAVPSRESPSRLQRIDEVFYPASEDISDCRPATDC